MTPPIFKKKHDPTIYMSGYHPDSDNLGTRPGHRIHIWKALYSEWVQSTKDLLFVLSQDEIERMRRFRFKRDREKYVVRRGLLRTILAHYTSINPEDIRFRYGERGKPFLLYPDGLDIYFNLTSSQDVILFAVGTNRNIGIDVEHVAPVDNIEALVDMFSESEQEEYYGLPEDRRLRGFYEIWTRSEAYAKATGRGLAALDEGFRVRSLSSTSYLITEQTEDEGDNRQWFISYLQPHIKYVGALCVDGHHQIEYLHISVCALNPLP